MDSRITIFALLIFHLSTAIFLAQATELPEHITNHGPFHLSWNSNQIRWDFVFSPKNITADIADFEHLVASNSSTVSRCQGMKGCLFKKGELTQAFNSSRFSQEAFIFSQKLPINKALDASNPCDKTSVKIFNYCSTHWNPPSHITGHECSHTIDWHSPYSCTANQTNYEIPCYVHDPSGKLIDLTHLVRSNGSSYEIDTGNFNTTIKQFHLNVCNEANKQCGPNVSSCRSGTNLVETGYSNLTTIKYDPKEESIHLESLGELNHNCTDKRVKTVVKFRCPKQPIDSAQPKLVGADDCVNTIDWPTVRACPIPDIQVPATSCAIKYEPLGIDINLKNVFGNQSVIEVSDIKIDGRNKTMIFGLCQGIPKSRYVCAGKSSGATSACLFESNEKNSTNAKNSEIVGSILKSSIKLTDYRLLLESFVNKTCQVPVTQGFNYTRQLGTRIEFVCSEIDEIKPKFMAFEDCIYVFEWGSSKLCFESMMPQTSRGSDSISLKPENIPSPSTSQAPITESIKEHENTQLDDTTKTAHDMHKDTVADSKDMLKPEEIATNPPNKPHDIKSDPKKDAINGQTPQPSGKMNKVHKFFMIGLIVMSLTAFVVVIFILDRKTNFKIPLGRIGRRARQAFRPKPVPYTRVNFNDNLDL